jgi:Uma2 family endonuclease
MQLQDVLSAVIGSDWCLRVQLPIETRDSEPEPDVALVVAPKSQYLSRHPSGRETGVVVEIADSTLRRDRRKARIYARAGVENYWIVHLSERQLEVHSHPDPKQRKYHELRILDANETIALNLGGRTIAEFAVADFLPPVQE